MLKSGLLGVTMCKHARSSPQPLLSLASLASCPGDSLGQWGTWGETGGRLEGQGEENRGKMRRARGWERRVKRLGEGPGSRSDPRSE